MQNVHAVIFLNTVPHRKKNLVAMKITRFVKALWIEMYTLIYINKYLSVFEYTVGPCSSKGISFYYMPMHVQPVVTVRTLPFGILVNTA